MPYLDFLGGKLSFSDNFSSFWAKKKKIYATIMKVFFGDQNDLN